MLVTNIISFSQHVSHTSTTKFQFLCHIFFSSINAFNLNWSEILSFSTVLKPEYIKSCIFTTLKRMAFNPLFNRYQQQTAFENIVGKGEIAHNEQFLLFPQCFLLYQIIASPFVHIFDIIYLFAAELEEPKIGILGEGFKTLKANKEIMFFISIYSL